MTTSWASFSWARPAMRRACSSEVKTCAKCSHASSVSIEPERLDQLRDCGRHEVVDRFAACDSFADVAGRDRQRLELEKLDALRTGEFCEHSVEPVAGIARACRNAEARTRDHALRILPGEEVAELVGTDQEQRFVPATGGEHVDRPLVGVALDLALREGGPRELQADVAVELHVLMSGPHGDDDDHLFAETPCGCVRERDVAVMGRIERSAEERRHWTSSTSPSTSTSSPLRAPAALSAAASSSSSAGAVPAMRKPRSVRSTRKRRPAGCGR